MKNAIGKNIDFKIKFFRALFGRQSSQKTYGHFLFRAGKYTHTGLMGKLKPTPRGHD